ncbi:hypothetical protein GBA52_003826 [Prunus armeniaca]|nr:hypothetical protein GBA52_003826 [Prunus armeniaca]
MLLQLMVDAASREWRDANGVLSKATVETKILPILNEKLRCGTQPQRNSLLLKKFGKTTLSPTQPTGIFKQKLVKTMRICKLSLGMQLLLEKNSLGLGDGIDARTFGVEDRQVGIEDFVYDNDTQAFVPNHNEASQEDPPLEHSSSSLPFQANIWTGSKLGYLLLGVDDKFPIVIWKRMTVA